MALNENFALIGGTYAVGQTVCHNEINVNDIIQAGRDCTFLLSSNNYYNISLNGGVWFVEIVVFLSRRNRKDASAKKEVSSPKVKNFPRWYRCLFDSSRYIFLFRNGLGEYAF